MKKLLILFITTILFGGSLKIVNLPQNSTIILDGHKFFNYNNNFIDIKYKNGTYDILIKNKEFLDIHLDDIDIDDTEKLITLNEENEDGTQYPVIKAKKFYKNIAVHYYRVLDYKTIYSQTNDYCQVVDCNVKIGSGLIFGDYKNVDRKNRYTSSLYVFKNNIPEDKIKVIVKSEDFYTTTNTSDLTENENIDLYPVSKWSSWTMNIGYGWTTDKVELKASDGDIIEENMDGFLLGLSYKHSTMFDIYWTTKLTFYYLMGDTDPSNSNNVDEMKGYQYGIGIGHIFKSLGGLLKIEGGMLQNDFSYKADRNDGFGDDGYVKIKTYTYDNTDIKPYIEISIYGWSFYYSESVSSINYTGAF